MKKKYAIENAAVTLLNKTTREIVRFLRTCTRLVNNRYKDSRDKVIDMLKVAKVMFMLMTIIGGYLQGRL